VVESSTGTTESTQPISDSRVCPCCSHDNTAETPSTYSCGSWKIKVCTNCRFVYLENVLPYDELVTNRAWTKSFLEAKHLRQHNQPVLAACSAIGKRLQDGVSQVIKRDKLQSLVNRFVQRGRLLDVGCGYGGALKKLKPEFVPVGIEIEAEMATLADRYARGRNGKVLLNDALSGLGQFPAAYFDGVVLQSFLEHEVQPGPMLEQCARVLSDRGHLIIKVPNYGCWNRRLFGKRWCGFRFPDHVNYFTPRSLRQMLRGAGFVPVRCKILDRLPTSDSLWMVARPE